MRSEKKLEILKEELVGKILPLWELNSKCIAITGEQRVDIRNYEPKEYMDDEGGSFAWGSNSEDQLGVYNVEFSIMDKDEEDYAETVVEVLDVRIV